MTKGDPKANAAATEKAGGRFPRRWLLLLVVVAGLNFFLGLLVGRGTPPLRFDILALQRELAALRETEIQSQIQRFRVVMEGSETRQPLDFYRDLKKDDKIAKPIPAPPAPKKKAAAVPKPASAVEPAAKPKPAANATGPMVQVAALRQAEAADKIVARLRALGFAVRSVQAKSKDRGTWYRVRVGPFADRQAAGEARDQLSRLNYDAIIVDP